eukprot:1244986-Rhodomonas_salina.1
MGPPYPPTLGPSLGSCELGPPLFFNACESGTGRVVLRSGPRGSKGGRERERGRGKGSQRGRGRGRGRGSVML